MGYDVHVTRADEWSESEATPITADEWFAYVAAADDLRLDGFAEVRLPDGAVLRTTDETMVVWTEATDGGEGPWFRLSHGAVTAKNPSTAELVRLHSIAAAFGARVQGDDGEEYGSDGQVTGTGASDSAPNRKPHRWLRRRG